MNDSIARAKFIDKLMTAVFYCVAGFFILLLVAFALYVIINGFKDFSWSLISFEGMICTPNTGQPVLGVFL